MADDSAPRPAWEGLLALHKQFLTGLGTPLLWCECEARWGPDGCASDAAVAARGWRDAEARLAALAARVAALEGALGRYAEWANWGRISWEDRNQPLRYIWLVDGEPWELAKRALRDGRPAPTTEGTPDPDVWEPLGIPGGYVRKRAAEDVGG